MKILVANKFFIDDKYSWNVFHKGDSFVKENEPFFCPEFTNEVSASLMFAVKMKRLGKFIEKRFASRYYDLSAFGLSFVAQDLKRRLLSFGENPSLSQNFEKSCVFGQWGSISEEKELRLVCNDNVTGTYTFDKNIYDTIDEIIEFASRYYTIKIGDIICFDLGCVDIEKISIGDLLSVNWGGAEVLSLKIK